MGHNVAAGRLQSKGAQENGRPERLSRRRHLAVSLTITSNMTRFLSLQPKFQAVQLSPLELTIHFTTMNQKSIFIIHLRWKDLVVPLSMCTTVT